MGKKCRGGPKIRSKLSKMRKIEKTWQKKWYYMHFDTKKFTKNYKMRVIKNKKHKKLRKKVGMPQN